MGAITKIAIFVIVVWGAMEFQTKGIEGAFGGFFAPEITNPIEHTASAPQRAKKVTERAFQETEERRNRMLGE
jgi:hypothetical protein